MKKVLSLIAVFASLSMSNALAQTEPTHTNYVPLGSESEAWYEAYESWQSGTPLYNGQEEAENENFFISRVKPRDRFVYTNTQVKEDLNPSRKLLWWCPIGVSSWNAVPSYFFNSEVFSMWSYVDVYGNWTAPMVQVPGAFLDICHKNGVAASPVAAIAWADKPAIGDKGNGSMIQSLVDGGYDKLLRYLNYYGIDGIGWNSEFYWTNMGTYMNGFKSLMGDCYANADAYGVPLFHNAWYSFTTNSGSIGDYSELNSGCSDWFHYNSKTVSSVYFLNYNWNASRLSSSQTLANSFQGRSSFDVYAGMNYQAGGTVYWTSLKNYDISVGLWGAHNMNMIYENKGENGSSSLQQQKTYQLISENSFTGSSYNPVNTPAISDNLLHSSKATNFHGFSSFIVARSTLTCDDLSTDPFVTYFNLGNGQFFNLEGETTFDKEWYNIGIQDYLPTWRWWMTSSFMGKDESDVSDDLTAEFTWDDAWFGGSCLQISGQTDATYLQLFKTKYATQANDKLTIRYKVLAGTGTLAWACTTEEKLGSTGTTEVSRSIASNATATDEWQLLETTVGGRTGIAIDGSTLALIGLKFTNTSSDFKVLIGEISLTRGTSVTPAQPLISTAKTLARNYKGVDAKVIFSMASDKAAPVYNADVNTWYFKVYTQQEDMEPVMCTATTSWAAYVVGAPYDSEAGGKIRIGVSAVSMDGKSESEPTWSDYMSVPAADIVEGFSIDKPVIKADEPFTIGFDDPNHDAASWEIKSASSGASMYKVEANEFTTKLPTEGLYDLHVTINGETDIYRGYIQISPAAVGAMPVIDSFTANGSEDAIDVETADDVEFAYVGRPDADGMVSRGIQLTSYGFALPIDQLNWPSTGAQPFTITYWFKINSLNPSTEGTTMLGILSAADKWPMNNWGYLWCDILPTNRIKIALRQSGSSEVNTDQYPLAEDFEFTTGTWYHMAWVFDYTSQRTANVYINGKLLGSLNNSNPYTWKTSYYIFFGGAFANRSALDANVDEFQLYDTALSADEIQASMNHFTQDELPSSLIGYWDFETDPDTDNTLKSVGTNKDLYAGMYEVVSTTENVVTYDPKEFSFTTGAPFISGDIYEIKTLPAWTLKGATVQSSTGDGASGSALVNYANEGQYTATLKLENGWGSATKEFSYVNVSASSGIEEVSVAEMQAFPNPFVDEVYIRFAEEGVYTIAVYDASGRQMGSSNVSATAGDMINIPVKGAAGIYYMKVYSGDTLLKAMKVIKK